MSLYLDGSCPTYPASVPSFCALLNFALFFKTRSLVLLKKKTGSDMAIARPKDRCLLCNVIQCMKSISISDFLGIAQTTITKHHIAVVVHLMKEVILQRSEGDSCKSSDINANYCDTCLFLNLLFLMTCLFAFGQHLAIRCLTWT